MKPKSLVRISNIIGIISIILLIYWVFIFIVSGVFGFKVFRIHITETFIMSIMGILALMAGALMINIMLNLTRIADKQNYDEGYKESTIKKWGLLFILSFPLIFFLLMGGDYLSSRKKEKIMLHTAESIVKDHKKQADRIADYSFTVKWLKQTEKTLYMLSETDRNFPHINVIVRDSIAGKSVFLQYRYHNIHIKNDSIENGKTHFTMKTTQEEREYMNDIFNRKREDYRFINDNDKYELFYPYESGNKIVIFYFSDHLRYGKFGS